MRRRRIARIKRAWPQTGISKRFQDIPDARTFNEEEEHDYASEIGSPNERQPEESGGP